MSQSDAYKEEISHSLAADDHDPGAHWAMGRALWLRGGKPSHVVLTDVLEPWLRAHNHIRFKGRQHAFSDANIHEAIARLVDEPFQSLMLTNTRLYELLTLRPAFAERDRHKLIKQVLHDEPLPPRQRPTRRNR